MQEVKNLCKGISQVAEIKTKVGSSAVHAPPVAAAAKMCFDAKIAVISTG